MSEIFPELLESTDVYFVTPSKKALRRFPTSDPIPPPLDRTMQAHRFLDDRIHRDVAEVADFALRKVPSLTIVLETGSKSLHNAPSPRLLVAVMSSRGISNESAVRFLMIRQMLFKGTQHQPPSMEAFGEANSNEVVRGENGAKSNNGESLPGSNFWEAPETTFYPDLLAPPQQRDSHQSLATGTTPMRPFGYDSSRGLELSAFSCDSR